MRFDRKRRVAFGCRRNEASRQLTTFIRLLFRRGNVKNAEKERGTPYVSLGPPTVVQGIVESDLIMSLSNNPEVEIQSPNSLRSNSNSDVFTNGEKRTAPTVYICGLLPKRYHNQALYAIAHDLMPDFFISTNPIQPNRWTNENSKDMLRKTEALIFLLNEVTVADRRCLLTLQYAWELNVPVVMLRQPRVRLIIKPTSAADKRTNNRSHHDDPSSPNMLLLQDVIYEAYKYSLEYDRNNHMAGMRKLVARLRQIVDGEHKNHQHCHRNNSDKNHDFHDSDNSRHLKLPPIPSPPNSLTNNRHVVLRRNTIAAANVTLRTSSLGNLTKKSKERNGSAINGHFSDETNCKHHLLATDDVTHRLLSPFESTDDPNLYHETQYLIFSVKDKSQKPRLIRFPSALTDKQDDPDADDIWGSDTSLEEEVGRAERVAGGLDVQTPPDTPAPYIDPL